MAAEHVISTSSIKSMTSSLNVKCGMTACSQRNLAVTSQHTRVKVTELSVKPVLHVTATQLDVQELDEGESVIWG